MWHWVASLLLLGIALLASYGLVRVVRGRRHISTRRLHLQQIARLEKLVAELNHYGNLLAKAKIDNSLILDAYETTLHRVEALLKSVRQIPNLQQNHKALQQLEPLIGSCEKQFNLFKKSLRRNTRQLRKIADWVDGLVSRNHADMIQEQVRGCFFCSRPFTAHFFAEIRIKFQDEPQKVWACHSCKDELKVKGELPVLYFRHEGEIIHWSKHPEYDPLRHFGNVKGVSKYQPRPQLKLVKSDEDPPPQ